MSLLMIMIMRPVACLLAIFAGPTLGWTTTESKERELVRWTEQGRSKFTLSLKNEWTKQADPVDGCYDWNRCESCWLTDCFANADEGYKNCAKNKTTEDDCEKLAEGIYNACGDSCHFCEHNETSCLPSEIFASTRFPTRTIYNKPAPDPRYAFIIGGIVAFVTAIHWLVRFHRVWKEIEKPQSKTKNLLIRSALVTLGDDDEPLFTILRTFSQGMLLLGGFQISYHLTVVVMLVVYTILSLRDTIRVLIAFRANKNVEDFVAISDRGKAEVNTPRRLTGATGVSLELETRNIYENLSCGYLIVTVVFITQCALVTCVIADLYKTWDSHTIPFGTANVPTVSSLGSWLAYVLGVFMQMVYLLGPKTNFGRSEQNPHYWVQLLLITKITGSRCKWHDTTKGKDMEIKLKPSMTGLWIRFIMSYLINGVGFHILVHALPIQVATQTSLSGIVIRALGMMYVVDLDDTPSMTLTLREGFHEAHDVAIKSDTGHDDKPAKYNGETALRRESEMIIQSVRDQAEQLERQLRNSLASLAAGQEAHSIRSVPILSSCTVARGGSILIGHGNHGPPSELELHAPPTFPNEEEGGGPDCN